MKKFVQREKKKFKLWMKLYLNRKYGKAYNKSLLKIYLKFKKDFTWILKIFPYWSSFLLGIFFFYNFYLIWIWWKRWRNWGKVFLNDNEFVKSFVATLPNTCHVSLDIQTTWKPHVRANTYRCIPLINLWTFKFCQ